MKVLLMHPERDFFAHSKLPAQEPALTQDLELETLWSAMAAGDPLLFEVAKRGTLASLQNPGAIGYRQQALRDCLEHPAVVRRLYELASEAVEAQKQVWRSLRDSPTQTVHTAVAKLEILLGFLRQVRELADEHADQFRSTAFVKLFAMLKAELGEEYLNTASRQLDELHFRKGILLTAELGKRNKGVRHVLRTPHARGLLARLGIGAPSNYSFTIPERDHAGFKALALLEDKGLNAAANPLGQAAEHVVAFFTMLRSETGFYVACLNLYESLDDNGAPTCFPTTQPKEAPTMTARGLYDPCLTLHLHARAVGNDIDSAGKSLVMITGANQGGKSTFLRSVGLAQLMLQAGMFVCAESFSADLCVGLFTHYKREEDATMTSGKLEEELSRMSELAGLIRPGAVLLCNESFSATNEREGSEIARQVVRAMLDSGVKILFVTHLFDLAHRIYQERNDALFLRAERRPDGTRTFRLHEGEPLPTSYGADSYRRIFGEDHGKGLPSAEEPTARVGTRSPGR